MRKTRSMMPFPSRTGFCADERGQDLVEYGLLASLIATFLIGTLNVVGDKLDGIWLVIANGIRY